MVVNLLFTTANVVAVALATAVLAVALWRRHTGARFEVQLHEQGLAEPSPTPAVATRRPSRATSPLAGC